MNEVWREKRGERREGESVEESCIRRDGMRWIISASTRGNREITKEYEVVDVDMSCTEVE